MSPSLNPAPVANLNMVPPTWFRPGDWAAGRAEPHPRLRTTLVWTPGFDAPSGHRAPDRPVPLRTRVASLPDRAAAESNATALLFTIARLRSLSLVDRPRNRSLMHACARQPPCECQLPCFRRSTRFRHSYRSRFRSPPPRLSNSLWLSDPTRLLPSSILSNAIALLHCRRSSTERLPTASRY